MVVCRRSSCPKKGEFLITSCFKSMHCLEGEKSAYQKLLTVMSSYIFLCSRGINGFAAMHILLLAPFFHEMSKCLQPLNIFFRTTRSVFLEKKICVWRLHFILYVSQLIFGKLSSVSFTGNNFICLIYFPKNVFMPYRQFHGFYWL